MQLASIPGHTPIKERLIRIAQAQQVPHAQLFGGPEGSPALPLALAFATYLHCQNKQPTDACGQCSACTKMQKWIHPDVQFIFPTAPTQQVKGKDAVSNSFLQSWRTFLQEQPYGNASNWSYHLGLENKQLNIPREEARQILQAISLKAFEGAYKIVLLWLPEYLHTTAANALLKVLEEPPPQTIFLLVSFQPEKLLGTIRSRVQHIHIPAFADQDLAKLLQQHPLAPAQLSQIVLLANGNLNKALQLAATTELPHFEQLKAWMRLCYTQNYTQLLSQAEAYQQQPKEAQKNFLLYALQLLREALVAPFADTGLARVTDSEQVFCQKLRSTLTSTHISQCTHWLNQAHYHLERNANPRILYLDLSLKVAHAFHSSPPKHT